MTNFVLAKEDEQNQLQSVMNRLILKQKTVINPIDYDTLFQVEKFFEN